MVDVMRGKFFHIYLKSPFPKCTLLMWFSRSIFMLSLFPQISHVQGQASETLIWASSNFTEHQQSKMRRKMLTLCSWSYLQAWLSELLGAFQLWSSCRRNSPCPGASWAGSCRQSPSHKPRSGPASSQGELSRCAERKGQIMLLYVSCCFVSKWTF